MRTRTREDEDERIREGKGRELGGEGRRGSGTVSEEIFLKFHQAIKSPKDSVSKIKKSINNAADSSVQIPQKSKSLKNQNSVLIFLTLSVV